ncbi:hypothetical protein B9Z55_027097 [Caenorhabditis nigoni]|uniref:Uncharacterized protein n=1 Tax=Caenorhabditis nigoni TaxID=1611254 RepID=A0A2G5SIL4_9PELO|nr:hypothetical protein B9Z55_027097 [Caenorhabditis nigoni]
MFRLILKLSTSCIQILSQISNFQKTPNEFHESSRFEGVHSRYGIQTVFEWNEKTKESEVSYVKVPVTFDKYEFTDKEMKEMRAQKNPALQKFLDEELPKRDPNAEFEWPTFTLEDIRQSKKEKKEALEEFQKSQNAPSTSAQKLVEAPPTAAELKKKELNKRTRDAKKAKKLAEKAENLENSGN